MCAESERLHPKLGQAGRESQTSSIHLLFVILEEKDIRVEGRSAIVSDSFPSFQAVKLLCSLSPAQGGLCSDLPWE